MNCLLRSHADIIIQDAFAAVMPEKAVGEALSAMSLCGRIRLLAVGKAAWRMARAAQAALGDRLESGLVITKYDHVMGDIPSVICREAAHPVPDQNSFAATEEAIRFVRGLSAEDTLLFLLSGGGSALFEKPLIDPEELKDITRQLLSCGADITEINTIRKRLSAVKGGRFARLCSPAKIEAIVLSDVVGDPVDMIASGPVSPDSAFVKDAEEIIRKYNLTLSGDARRALLTETPKEVDNVKIHVTANVKRLCEAAEESCRRLGYETRIVTTALEGEALLAGRAMASLLTENRASSRPLAFIAGGETVVKLRGSGLGGRNQELALSAAEALSHLPNAALFSVSSDGGDGPTDAAGGYVDADTLPALKSKGILPEDALADNDSYHALEAAGGLIITGPTGTNVNDLTVGLINPGACQTTP